MRRGSQCQRGNTESSHTACPEETSNQTDLANTLQSKKCQKLMRESKNPGNPRLKLLNEIYTELYITEGGEWRGDTHQNVTTSLKMSPSDCWLTKMISLSGCAADKPDQGRICFPLLSIGSLLDQQQPIRIPPDCIEA
ncbi:hypothetical protein NFI96_031887, partial [Prochilodus magdalenae]